MQAAAGWAMRLRRRSAALRAEPLRVSGKARCRYRRRLAMTPQQKRIVCPIIDQDGERVGVHHALPEELLYVNGYVDENGTVWTPPTAYAYAMVCKSRDRLGESLERVWDAYGFDTS